MKKFVTLGLVAVLGTALAVGCKKKEETTTETTTTTTEAPPSWKRPRPPAPAP